MINSTNSLDWSLLQSFLAVAETGSLSAAARQIGASQPTVGRHVQALEAQLGDALFIRQANGMALSEAGEKLLPPARQMAEAANQMSLANFGASQQMEGSVRVTASVFTAQQHLPPIFAKLRVDHPEIEIELVANNASENLLFREADIAVRMYRPEQLELVTRHLGDFGLGIYAARSYLERAGTPLTFEELAEHPLVGYDRNEMLIHGIRAYGWDVTRRNFPVRTDDDGAYWHLVKEGAGLGVVQSSVADREPELVKLLPELKLPGLGVWLSAHQIVRHTPRVKVVWDALEEGLLPHLSPPGHLPAMPA